MSKEVSDKQLSLVQAITREAASDAIPIFLRSATSLLQAITPEVASASDFRSAIGIVLRRVCEKTGWALGQAWVPNEEKTHLVCGPAWFCDAADDLTDFRAVSEKSRFERGVGLPGRVWESKQPTWIEDVASDLNFPRIQAAQSVGLKTAVGMPMLSGGEVIAVIEFFLRGSRSENEALVNVIAAVAAQLDLAIERKATADELSRTNEIIHSILSAMGDAVIVADTHGTFLVFNPAAERIFGRSAEPVPVNEWPHRYGLFLPDKTALFPHDRLPLSRSIRGEEVNDVEMFVRNQKVPQGLWIRITGRPLHAPNGDLLGGVIVCRDVSAQKRADMQLQVQREEMSRHNRISLMGEMTASFAHELNQPLAAIATNAAAAQRFLERGNIDPAMLQEILQDLIADSQRAANVIQGIRSLVRKETSVKTRLNLNSVVEETVRLVSTETLSRESVVTTELDPRLPQVNAALVQIQQVLLNLIMNALDASLSLNPAERRIIIRTRSDKGDTAEVTVRDFGVGIPTDRPDKVFDHFFSTKQKGMGMGLTIVRSIVEAHGGTITAQNAPDRGAQFILRFPAARGEIEKHKAAA